MKTTLMPKILNDLTIEPAIEQLVEPPIADKQSVKIADGKLITSTSFAFKVDTENKRVDVWLFGVLRNTREYSRIITMMYSLSAEYVLHLYIHSPGGSITVGCNILTAMEKCLATIITHNVGLAASCGSLLLSFGKRISISPNSTTMFHNAGFGNFDSAHRLLTQTQHTIANVMRLFERMRARGIITESEIEGIVKRGEEYYFTSDEMVRRLRAGNILYEGEC